MMEQLGNSREKKNWDVGGFLQCSTDVSDKPILFGSIFSGV